MEPAAQAGADVVGIAGVADLETVKGAVEAAEKYNIVLMADLIAVNNPFKRAKDLEKAGVDVIEYHTSIDKQNKGESVAFDQLKVLASSLEISVAVAGGLDHTTVAKAKNAGAKVCIVGGAINSSDNPELATKRIIDSF